MNVRTVVPGALAWRGDRGIGRQAKPHDAAKAHTLLTKTAVVHAVLLLFLTQLGRPEVGFAPPHCMTVRQHVMRHL